MRRAGGPRSTASFPRRLTEARAAIKQRDRYQGELDRAVAWWQAHKCRELSPLEIAIRKLDDPRSFLCDTAKPAWMTRKFNDAHRRNNWIFWEDRNAPATMFEYTADQSRAAKHGPTATTLYVGKLYDRTASVGWGQS